MTGSQAVSGAPQFELQLLWSPRSSKLCLESTQVCTEQMRNTALPGRVSTQKARAKVPHETSTSGGSGVYSIEPQLAKVGLLCAT